MADTSTGRVSIVIKCAPDFRDRVDAYAKRHGQSRSDAVTAMIAEVLKFDEFDVGTARVAAEDDWQMMSELSRDGKQIP